MTDYSQLSDQQINMLVAKIEHPDKTIIESKSRPPSVLMIDVINTWFDYCNNPSDAWSIIIKFKIDIQFRTSMLNPVPMAKNGDLYSINENPLRAAMIVFLQMQENK